MKNDANTSKNKKISKIVGIVSTVFLVLCVGIFLYSTISYAKTGLVNFFGYSFHVIQTPSMEPEIKVDDLVVVKKVPYDQIDVGDDILFKCQDASSPIYGKYIVHRVKEKTETEGVYVTYGINNNDNIEENSKAEGKVVAVNSSLGGLFSFITQGRNVIFIIAIFGFVIFLILQLCSVVSNSAKLKSEKDKERLNNDAELREKLKKEIQNELNISNDSNKDDKADGQIKENQQKNEEISPQNTENNKNDAETGGDGL